MRRLWQLAPLTPEQEATLNRELDWLRSVVPTGYGLRAEMAAMDTATDPFSVNQPQRLNRARWFAQLWNTFDFPDGVHLRRIHYVLVSQDDPVPLPDRTAKSIAMAANMAKRLGSSGGMRQEIYVNDKICWNWLCEAGRDARLLGLVPSVFEDKRNDEPREFLFGEFLPGVSLRSGLSFHHIEEQSLLAPSWVTTFREDDVETPQVLQPYHLEVWAEKTTMDDILEPLCERLGVNLITGAGHASLTMVDKFMQRVRDRALPARILYVADADKYGQDMPIAAARKIEHRHRHPENEHLDLVLRHIVLTQDQIDEYTLPVSPIDGVSVELDALEAIRPGEFERIVESEIRRYHDPNLDEKVDEAFDDFKADVEAMNDAAVTETEREELEELDRQRDALVTEFNARLAPLNVRAAELFAGIRERLAEGDTPVFDPPLPEPEDSEHGDPLYDSSRDYLDQLEGYRRERERFRPGDAAAKKR
jgi:hypothetical protein